MSSLNLTVAENQTRRLHVNSTAHTDARSFCVQDLVTELRTGLATCLREEEEDLERHLATAQCLMALTRLRADATGMSLREVRAFKLEEKRLQKYTEKVQTARIQRRRKDPAAAKHVTSTGRFISHALWSDLTSAQKKQFKKV